jgi:hypothetical protein
VGFLFFSKVSTNQMDCFFKGVVTLWVSDCESSLTSICKAMTHHMTSHSRYKTRVPRYCSFFPNSNVLMIRRIGHEIVLQNLLAISAQYSTPRAQYPSPNGVLSLFVNKNRNWKIVWHDTGIRKVRKTQHQNPEFGVIHQVRFKKINLQKKSISIKGGLKLRKPSILVIN